MLLSKNLIEEINHIREKPNDECLLINKKESIHLLQHTHHEVLVQ